MRIRYTIGVMAAHLLSRAFAVLFITGFAAAPSFAQITGDSFGSLTSSFTLEASDSNPSPHTAVTVRVNGFTFDRDPAQYNWYVNGAWQSSASGRGRTDFTLQSGKPGESKTVRVDVTTASGNSRSESVTIVATEISAYWWSDTTVPYWYKGKALPSDGAPVTILLNPHGISNASQLHYRWRINDDVIPNSAGTGRTMFTTQARIGVKENITATITNESGTFNKTVSIGLGAWDPLVGIYQMKPLHGIVPEKLLTAFSGVSGEPHDFTAVPFFFPKGLRLTYLWTLNGQPITGTFSKPHIFTLRSQAGTPSQDHLSVEISNSANRILSTQSGVSIELR